MSLSDLANRENNRRSTTSGYYLDVSDFLTWIGSKVIIY